MRFLNLKVKSFISCEINTLQNTRITLVLVWALQFITGGLPPYQRLYAKITKSKGLKSLGNQAFIIVFLRLVSYLVWICSR